MKLTRSILSIAFALLVLLSSSSFTVGIHLCGGQIENIALFSKSDGCEMEKKMPPCHKPQSKPCCEDETIIHNGEDFKVTKTDIAFSPEAASVAEFHHVIISEVIPPAPVSRASFQHYSPPLRAADLTISLQVFLI